MTDFRLEKLLRNCVQEKKKNRNNCDLHSFVKKNIYEENRLSKCKHVFSLEKEQNANSLGK